MVKLLLINVMKAAIKVVVVWLVVSLFVTVEMVELCCLMSAFVTGEHYSTSNLYHVICPCCR